jgi:hypothetical protein
MPTFKEREYYRMGFRDGLNEANKGRSTGSVWTAEERREYGELTPESYRAAKPKRKLSAWNKYVKANSKKPRFRYRNGKLNLKKMAIAFRKTPAGRKSKRR